MVVTVTIAFKDNRRQAVLLAGVPREGDNIRLRNGATDPVLFVTQVIWEQGNEGQEPNVICVVEPAQK